MSLDSLSREVKMICRACGNDEFEYDDAVGDLADAPDETELKCIHCGLVATKGELMEDNSESTCAAVDELAEDIAAAAQKELDAALKEAFR